MKLIWISLWSFILMPNQAIAQITCHAGLPKGSHCVIQVQNLRPTQPEVGLYQVKKKADELKDLSPSEIDSLARKKEVPCIIGPDRQFYLIDHHHQSLAFLLNGTPHAYVNVIENWTQFSSLHEFWSKMCNQNWCYRLLADGSEISPLENRFPRSLDQCGDNPYRSLVWLLIKDHRIEEGSIPYFEFKVGEILRNHSLWIKGSPSQKEDWEPYLKTAKELLKKDSIQREIKNL